MADILGGLVLVNGTDIWTEYGVFLVEDRRGGMENLSAILTPSKTKKETAVDIREEDGEKYSAVLTPRNEARDVTLHFALYNKTKAGWLKKYFAFINFLKKGKDGWLDIAIHQLDLRLRVRYTDSLFVAGRGPRREIQGEVPRAGTDYITIQRRFEYAFNDIR